MITLLTVSAYVVLIVLLLVAALIDIRKRVVPNQLVIGVAVTWSVWQAAMIAVALAFDVHDASTVVGISQATTSIDALGLATNALTRILEAVIFGAMLLGMTLIYERMRGKLAFGGGDIKLLAALTLFTGIEAMLACLMISCMVSLLYTTLSRKTITSRGIPFAPCVACALPLTLLIVNCC